MLTITMEVATCAIAGRLVYDGKDTEKECESFHPTNAIGVRGILKDVSLGVGSNFCSQIGHDPQSSMIFSSLLRFIKPYTI